MQHRVTEHRLSNGARGIVIDVPGASVFDAQINFNSGFIYADARKFEVPHVMEHLMSSGTKRFPSNRSFRIEVERNGAFRNAYTNIFWNRYVYQSAEFERDRILELLTHQVTEPLFTAPTLAGELGNVRDELRRYDEDYASLNRNQLLSVMLPNGHQTVAERLQRLDSITLADATKHYSNTHTASNLRFSLAGSFPDGGTSVAARLEKLLGTLPTGKQLAIPTQPLVERDRALWTNAPVKQLYYEVRCFLPDLKREQLLALNIICTLLTGGYQSWIYGLVREKGLAYGVSSGFQGAPSTSSFGLSGSVGMANAPELFKLFCAQLQRLAGGELSANELAQFQRLKAGRLARNLQTPADLMAWYSDTYCQEGKIDDIDSFLAEIAQIQASDIADVYRWAVQNGRWAVSFVGDIDEKAANRLYEFLQPIWL